MAEVTTRFPSNTDALMAEEAADLLAGFKSDEGAERRAIALSLTAIALALTERTR